MKNILLIAIVIFGLNTISIAQVPNYVPTNGLVGWWPFTGNANDLSVNGNNGTVYGATLTSDRNSNLNSAYYFNGNAYMAVPNIASTGNQARSVFVWIKYNSTFAYHCVISTGNPSSCNTFNLFANMNNSNGNIGVMGFNPCDFYSATTNMNNNQWHLIGAVYNGLGTLQTYLDGVLFSTASMSYNTIGQNNFFGCNSQNMSAFYIGILDDIGIWNRALTACEINQLYTGGIFTTTSAATICAGASTTITASGATTYAWMPGNLTGATITVSPTATTTYTVTGTNANGCVNTATTTVTVNPLPVVTATSSAAAVCTGASVTLTGGGAATYAWSGGVTNAVSFIPTATTTYTVTGTSAAGCINTATITVTVNPLPVVTATSTAAAVCAGASVTLTGGGALTYVWSGGVTNAVSFIPTATTTYTVTGTNINGCVNTATITVTVNPLPVVTTTTTAPSICIGASTTITANGATTYAWMPGNLTGATITVSPTATTTYTVTGTNANGCVNTATRIITVNPLPIVTATSTAASVCTGSNVTLTGGGATSYTWSGGVTNAVSFIPTATTTYTVTGTNINGCVNTATITVTVNPLPVVTATSTAAAICVGGSVTLTGGGATSYSWSGGVTNAVSFIPTATTTYTVTGTNINGCVNTAAITVTVNPLPVVTATSTAPSICLGGSVTLAANGASNYNWMPGNISGFLVSVSPTATTTYTVTGTNINGCVNTATITVTVNPLPVVTATSTAPSICIGGSVTLAANGASNYNWMPGNLSGFLVSVSPTATTTYTVTGTNANACVNTATITVIVNPLPLVTANSSAASVCTGSSVTLTGGGAATYTWDNNVTDAVSFVPTATTTYMVTGTDVNACVNTAMTTVTVNPLPTVTANSSAVSVCTGGSVTLTGGGAATYTWDNNVMNAISFVPTATTTYIVTGTDMNGCMNTAMTTVTVNPLPIVTATSSSAAVCIGASVTLTGVGATTYTWDNNVMDAVSFVPSATTTYMVTGTDANGCVNTAMITVTVNPLPIVTASSSAASVCTGSSVTLTGGGASTYTWDNNVMDAVSFVPTATTTYMVTGTDVNGCVNTATTTVTVNSLPLVSLGQDLIQCGGTALLNAGNIGSVYLWNNASTTQTITVSASGTYIVVVTDVNGCNGSDTAVVTINSNPSVSAAASSSVVCVDDANVTLTGTPTGGVWSGLGVNGLFFSPTAAGVGLQSAVYSYTDINGCEGMDSVSIQVNACVGLAENILANGVSVYPNPNNGSFILSASANVGDLTIKITDMQGRVVYASVDKNVSAGFVKQISLDTQSSGMYLMHILANGEQQTKKISVQK